VLATKNLEYPYCPRSGYESRMVGGVFQGANRSDFSDSARLFTVTMHPPSGAFTPVSITNAAAFRYVRHLSPDGGFGNVAELEFYGYLSPTVGSLIHRYRFLETGGTNVADAVGGPVWTGILPDGGVLSNGQLALSSASRQYVNLPPGILGSLSNITVLAWVNLATSSDWNRIFDFGNNTTTYMFLTPQAGSGGALRFVITTNGSSAAAQQIDGNTALTTGVWHQLAVTLSSGVGIIYLDGVAVGTNSAMTINPASLGLTANNYIGKAQIADPYLDGSIEEFRIYNVGLSSAEIAATAALGPAQLLNTNSPQMAVALLGTNLAVSWPLADAGFTLQSNTNLATGV